jgi:hypothetical protein
MNEHEREQQLEGLLDSALAQYGAVEPLHGMEERVLRRLHAGRTENASRRLWVWGGVVAALAAVVLAVVVLAPKADRKPVPLTAHKQPEVVVPAPHEAAKQAVAKQSAPKQRAMPVVAQPPQHDAVTATGSLPRRAVFPTPAPPTEQEVLLARYLRVTPREEVLAQINRTPLEFHEDPWSVPAGGDATSPQKAEGKK